MRLDPVYLVAPKPSPTPPPSRRAFLAIGTTFGLGSLVGGACGYSVGANRRPNHDPAIRPRSVPVAADAASSAPPTEDATLLALRRLAVDAPIDDLVANWNAWFMQFSFEYGTDPVLWQGTDRLAEWAADHLATADVGLLTALAMAGKAEWRGDDTTLRRQLDVIQGERRARARGR